MKKIIVIYFLSLLNLNYSQCRVNFVNIGGDYTLEIVESGEDFEVISHNGIGADFSATIATGRLQKADFQVKIVKYGSINSKCGFNQKNSGNSGSYANPGQWQKNYNMFEGVTEGLKETADQMDRNLEQMKQNYSQKNNNTYNSSGYNNGNSSKIDREYSKKLRDSGLEKFNKYGDYYGAVEDFDRALRFTDDIRQLSLLHVLIGKSKADLKNDYYGAIKEYNIAIEISPDWSGPFESRAWAKYKLGLEYCSDYKKACELGDCENYNKSCR